MIEDELARRFLDVLDAYAAGVPARFLPTSGSLKERRNLSAMGLPCLRWLARLNVIVSSEAHALVSLLRDGELAFRWGQTYGAGDFGEGFLENYGWLEVFGSRGYFRHDEIAGGLLLLGAETFYPDHRHVAEEIYVPLTGGSEWQMGDGPFRRREAGEVLHHASNVAHAMRTGAEPMLALYLWRGGPLDQKSEIGPAIQSPSQARSG